MFYGKLVAGAIGYLVLGPFGLVLGLLVGHAFDRGLLSTLALANPERLREVRDSFSETCFTLLGYLAKADGRVSEEEVAHAEQIMVQLGVSGSQREQAIAHFKRGASADFQPEPLIEQFLGIARGHRQVQQTLLVFLISMALADGKVDSAEQRALETCAVALGFSASAFQRLLDMVQAQQHFHGQQTGGDTRTTLADAYRALGVQPDCSDRDLKRAYRKLMSQNHPDKLIAQGVPEDMIKLATEKSQEIQAAYELIKQQRKSGA